MWRRGCGRTAAVDTALKKSAIQKRQEKRWWQIRLQSGLLEQTSNKLTSWNQHDEVEATTRIELVYTVLQTVA
jgi:hypothetical protein